MSRTACLCVSLRPAGFLRQPRAQVAQVELGVDLPRDRSAARASRRSSRIPAGNDDDAERDRTAGLARRVRARSPCRRPASPGTIRSDEHARRTELQLERQREGLLDRGSGRFRRQPAHRHASNRDVDRDCCGGRIVGRSRTRCDHTGEQQAGNEGEQERGTLHAGNIVKIPGSFVITPSTPSRTRRSASRGSSTVQATAPAPASAPGRSPPSTR